MDPLATSLPPLPAPAAPTATRPETSRAYAADLRAFRTWCAVNGRVPLPAGAETVAAYLNGLAATHRPGTLRRKRSAIAQAHRQAGLPSPPAIAISSEPGRAPARGRPAALRPTPAQLERLALACPRDPAGRRDRALLLLRAQGLGRIDLLGLTAEQVTWTSTGVTLSFPPLHSGQPPRCRDIARRGGPCPVRALQEWMDASECRFGPVFRKIDRWGNIELLPLQVDALRRILRRRHRPRSAAMPRPQA